MAAGLRSWPGLSATALVFSVFSATAQAVVITFDDLVPDPGPNGPIPDGYNGFDWSTLAPDGSFIGFDVIDGAAATALLAFPGMTSGYENGTVSGPNVAFCCDTENDLGTIIRSVSGAFDFNGTYLTAAWRDGLNVTVSGLLGGAELFSSTVVVDTTGPTFFNFNYLGIDELRFTTFGGVDAGLRPNPDNPFRFQVAMDNFTFNEVPEPGILALFAMGLVALGVYRRCSHRPALQGRQIAH